MSESLNDRLQQAASGVTPQTKPDERRKFLGSLRERTYLRMTVAQTQNPKLQQLFLEHIDDYRPYSILINGKMPQTNFVNKVMQACSHNNIKFTLINDQTAKNEPDATGILVVAKDAINRYRIEIDQVYAPSIEVADKLDNSQPKKHSFFRKLFRKGN
ncbi:YueI family protein [Lactobacillus sp. PV034]|uniref:YueI family protein n=1 Tax=Lactobacillus sp. PV034 TaxID=2594495 RepID=UPI00223F8982|nr:YueI family protein [Lactobacillus sp. PV034]QNQ80642.1 DUF1694 domain-containing protein [Lactobacillus sp. PV034]